MSSLADRADAGKFTPGGLTETPAAKLTPAQVAELAAKTGQTPQQITGLNAIGFDYDEILAMGQADGPSEV